MSDQLFPITNYIDITWCYHKCQTFKGVPVYPITLQIIRCTSSSIEPPGVSPSLTMSYIHRVIEVHFVWNKFNLKDFNGK